MRTLREESFEKISPIRSIAHVVLYVARISRHEGRNFHLRISRLQELCYPPQRRLTIPGHFGLAGKLWKFLLEQT
jgi:hypothetical protein